MKPSFTSAPVTRRHLLRLLPSAGLGATLASCSKQAEHTADGRPIIRFGHFPNITHVQALVAHNLTRQGQGWFEKRLNARIDWFTYNAGPSAIEAIFARALDVTYIGPSPVLNAYAKSRGEEPRILAGAANGGSALVVRPDSGIRNPSDFRGKTVATPQLGNTQDIQLRAWLTDHGFKVTQTGGDVRVQPVSNADLLPLFSKGDIHAAWTVEPWVARLELEAGASVFLADRETTVTLLAGRSRWLQENPELARSLVAAHRELTQWVIDHPEESRRMLKDELKALTTAAPSDEVVERALGRTVLDNGISRASLESMVRGAQKAGFLADIPSLDSLVQNL
jgi:NitT/TauT family transport system substrate-binding protein